MYFWVREVLHCWGALRGSIWNSQLGFSLHTLHYILNFVHSDSSWVRTATKMPCYLILCFILKKINWGEALRSCHSFWKPWPSYGILESISLDKWFSMPVNLVRYIPQHLNCQLHLHIQCFKADRHGLKAKLWLDSMSLLRFICQLQSTLATSSQESVTEVLSVIRYHTSGMLQACTPVFSWAFGLHWVHTAPVQLTFG